MNEIISYLLNNKKEYLINPKGNEFKRKLISIFGKSFNEQEIEELIKLNDKDFPLKITSPFVGLIKPTNNFNNVLFPDPEVPIKLTISPLPNSIDKSFKTFNDPS